MTTPPISPNEPDPEQAQLASEIQRALSNSRVEFRDSARELAVAAALHAHKAVETERSASSTRSQSQRWLLVAACIVVVCVGLLGAFTAGGNGDADQLAVTADAAAGAEMADGQTSAEMAPEMADEAGDANAAERNAATEENYDAAQDFTSDSEDAASSPAAGLESDAASTLRSPTPSATLISELRDRGIGVAEATMNGSNLIDFGAHDTVDGLLAELELLNQRLAADSVNTVNIDAATTDCIHNYMSLRELSLDIIIGYTVIADTMTVVTIFSDQQGQSFATIPLESCSL